MATDSFADAVASFRYLRNNAMTPVHIRKKDITAPIISSRSSLRKSGSINCCLRMNHLQSAFRIFSQRGRETRSSNALNSLFAIPANIRQKLTKCEHREDASPVMPAQQRPPISHQKRRGASMIQFVCDSCRRVKEASETWIVGRAAEAVGVTAARREVTIQSAWIGRLRCILLLFTSAPLSARTATWRNYSRLTLLRKKELLSGQLRQKSWLKEAAQSRASRRERERVKSIAPSGRLDTILLSRYEQLSGNTKRSTVLNCFWKQSTVPVATWSTPRLPPDAHESVVEAADAS